MHAVFATRGIDWEVDKWITYLRTRTVGLPLVKDGKAYVQPQSIMVQPIQLWSVVFPEACSDAVLTALRFDKDNIERWSGNARMKMITQSMRMAMGLKKVPAIDPTKAKTALWMPDDTQNISIIPIGVKYDPIMKFSDGTEHEAI
jgi:hypothetical protein